MRKVLFICLIAVFLLVFSSCEPQPKHEHTFSAEWNYDDAAHWHAATCGHDEVSDKAPHSWDDGEATTPATCTTNGVMTYTCTVCEATKEEQVDASHSFGPEVNLGNGVKSKTCTECGYENIYAEDKTVILALLPNNGEDTIYLAGNPGDTVALPNVTKSGIGITDESFNTTKDYQLACWFDDDGNEYLPGSMYTFTSGNATLQAWYGVNVAIVKGDAHYDQFEGFFNGTYDYSSLDLDAVLQTITTNDVIATVQAKSSSVFTVPAQYLPEGHHLVDIEGNEYGLSYKAGESDFILASLPNVVSVTYKANGGVGDDLVKKVPYGYSVNLAGDDVFLLDNYVIKDWNTKEDGNGVSYSGTAIFTEDTVLYAQWVTGCTITFDANGGNGTMAPKTSIYEIDVTLTANSFEKTGHVFVGWNTKADGRGTWYADKYIGKFTSDVTLYAQWGLPMGSEGQAGGLIFYDCDADNATGNADGLKSSECGWRYLEAAPENIKIGSTVYFISGYYRTSSSGSNLYVNGTTTYVEGTSDSNDGKSTGTAIGTGKTNTEKLVKAMGSAAYNSDSGTDKTDQYAANLADNYVYGKYDDWFLPSKDELNLMYTNLHITGLGNFASGYYCSSSEYYLSASNAWLQSLTSGTQTNLSRSNTGRVRCVRSFTPIEQLDPSTIYLAETTDPTCTEAGWKVYKYVDTGKEACRVLDNEPKGHVLGSDKYHCDRCGRLMVETGIKGPAGGYVFYDCDADNATGNADGLISTECGWRYLEAAPTDLSSGANNTFIIGYYRETDDGNNLYVNGANYVEGTSNPNDGKSTGTAIGTGKANTEKLVKAMGSAAYKSDSGTDKTELYAAKLADDYVYGGYDDWFLPSKDEILLIYSNLRNAGIGDLGSSYWSSSETTNGAHTAWLQGVASGVSVSRSATYKVRCIRAF